MCSEDVLEDVDNFGRSALHLAALGGHGEVVEFLLNRGGIMISHALSFATAMNSDVTETYEALKNSVRLASRPIFTPKNTIGLPPENF